jgi:hypothetical protein
VAKQIAPDPETPAANAVATPVPSPDIPVATGNPVAFVNTPADGVPRFGVVIAQEVVMQKLPVPLMDVHVQALTFELGLPNNMTWLADGEAFGACPHQLVVIVDGATHPHVLAGVVPGADPLLNPNRPAAPFPLPLPTEPGHKKSSVLPIEQPEANGKCVPCPFNTELFVRFPNPKFVREVDALATSERLFAASKYDASAVFTKAVLATLVLLSDPVGVGTVGEFVNAHAVASNKQRVVPDVPVLFVAAVPNPRFVRAVDALPTSDRLLAAFNGVNPSGDVMSAATSVTSATWNRVPS